MLKIVQKRCTDFVVEKNTDTIRWKQTDHQENRIFKVRNHFHILMRHLSIRSTNSISIASVLGQVYSTMICVLMCLCESFI